MVFNCIGLSWMIWITIEHCRTLKAINGLDGLHGYFRVVVDANKLLMS